MRLVLVAAAVACVACAGRPTSRFANIDGRPLGFARATTPN